MTTDLVTAPEGTSLEKAKEILHANRIEKLLIVNKKFELRGLVTIKDIKKNLFNSLSPAKIPKDICWWVPL